MFTPETLNQYFTPREAAEASPMTEMVWYHLTRTEKVKTLRIGGRVLIEVASAVAELERRGHQEHADALRARLG